MLASGPLPSPVGTLQSRFTPWLKPLVNAVATGHNHPNNGFFKLVETLLHIRSSFFSQSINVRGLPLSAVTVSLHCLTRSLRSTATLQAKRLLLQYELNF